MSVTMLMSPFLGRIHCLCPALPLNGSAPLASSKASTQVSSQNPNFAVEYLVQSCGLSSGEAHRASKHIQHLKSPDKPDAALRFLTEIGISESDIRTAVLRDSRILCSHVENNMRPNIAHLKELGFSIEDISGIMSRYPILLRFNIVEKLDSWLGVLGSVDYLSVVMKRQPGVIQSSFENVTMPNVSFLQEQCGLSVRQIVQLIKTCPRLIKSKTEILKMKAEEADQLGVARSSGTFVQALTIVYFLSQDTIDSRLNNFRNLGLSHEEVALMISKAPYLLSKLEKETGRTMEFLINEAGCSKIDLVRNPSLLMYSLEKRLIPRCIVRKLLMSEGLPVSHSALISFMNKTETCFVEKFILPYEHVIPGLHQAYADASDGKIVEIECFKRISS
ncbi:transcription termination factor MTERF8, chloroplastic-like [Carex rostrata]